MEEQMNEQTQQYLPANLTSSQQNLLQVRREIQEIKIRYREKLLEVQALQKDLDNLEKEVNSPTYSVAHSLRILSKKEEATRQATQIKQRTEELEAWEVKFSNEVNIDEQEQKEKLVQATIFKENANANQKIEALYTQLNKLTTEFNNLRFGKFINPEETKKNNVLTFLVAKTKMDNKGIEERLNKLRDKNGIWSIYLGFSLNHQERIVKMVEFNKKMYAKDKNAKNQYQVLSPGAVFKMAMSDFIDDQAIWKELSVRFTNYKQWLRNSYVKPFHIKLVYKEYQKVHKMGHLESLKVVESEGIFNKELQAIDEKMELINEFSQKIVKKEKFEKEMNKQGKQSNYQSYSKKKYYNDNGNKYKKTYTKKYNNNGKKQNWKKDDEKEEKKSSYKKKKPYKKKVNKDNNKGSKSKK